MNGDNDDKEKTIMMFAITMTVLMVMIIMMIVFMVAP